MSQLREPILEGQSICS